MPIGMEMKLQVKLSQQLVMTPQLVQAIRLLQLSRMELVEEVRKELDGNPVLADENIEPKDRGREAGAEPAPEPAERGDGESAASAGTSEASGAETSESDKVNEVDWERYLENQQLRQPVGSSRQGF